MDLGDLKDAKKKKAFGPQALRCCDENIWAEKEDVTSWSVFSEPSYYWQKEGQVPDDHIIDQSCLDISKRPKDTFS